MNDNNHSRRLFTEQPTYDYSKLLAAAMEESQTSFSSFINEKIRDLRNKSYDGEVRKFNRSTIADQLGMDLSTLTKIINQTQATRKRDVIIAICVTLQMTESETNLALNLYPMAPLNPYNLRDLVIIQALHDKLPVKTLNVVLSNHEMPRLNILRGDSKSKLCSYYYPYSSTAYEEDSIKITPYCVDAEYSNISLHERYYPDKYNYYSEMIVRNKADSSEQYRIELDGGNTYDIFLLTGDGDKHLYSDNYIHQKFQEAQPCDNADLLTEVTKLKEYTERKARYVHQMCNDTRYYGRRFSADNEHGQLVIYGECFGYDAPELCEYYQIEVSSTQCVFTVSDTSSFMRRYLGEAEWLRLYGNPLSPPSSRFTSLSEITELRWKKQFADLLKSARELLTDLQQRKLFLFNAKGWLGIDNLMHLFKVEDDFDCIQDDEYGLDAMPRRDQIDGPDGKPITVDDLWLAAELDITSVTDLCAIRTRYGSLEQFLQLDILDFLHEETEE